MSVALVTAPTYAVPAKNVRVAVSLSGGGNWARVWCTAAPAGSRYRTELDAPAARVLAYDGPATADWQAELSVGGVYSFAVQEYSRAAGGGYAGAPSAWPAETKVGAEGTATLSVGQRLVCQLGTQPFGGAQLVLWVWGDTIRATTKATHGEATPAIGAPSAPRAAAAALSATVATTLAALVDKTAAVALGDLAALHASMAAKLPAHMRLGATTHAAADTTNPVEIEDLPSAPASPAGYGQAAAVMRRRLALHMSNGQDGSDRTHYLAGHSQPDAANVPAAPEPARDISMAAVMAAYADIWRAFEAHRVNTAAHGTADAANVLSALPPLLQLHRDFIAAMRGLSPTAPAVVNPAVTALIHGAGFAEG